MSHPAKSMFVFGIYLAGSGAILILTPNTLFALLGLPSTSEVWVRVVGVLTLVLAFYFIQAARKELTDFFRWTGYARISVMIFFTAFVLLGFVGPVLILFGLVDLLGAIWTGSALRSLKTA
jgi:hypothetical protein